MQQNRDQTLTLYEQKCSYIEYTVQCSEETLPQATHMAMLGSSDTQDTVDVEKPVRARCYRQSGWENTDMSELSLL